MNGQEISGKQTGNGKKRIRIKPAVYLLLVVCLLASCVYVATALENQVTGLTISPDPVKIGFNTTISYTLGQASTVNVVVYKESGELVRNILSSGSKLAGANRSVWDSYDNNSTLVPDGSYKIVVEATDATGAQTGLAEKVVIAARSPLLSNVSDTPDPFNPLNGDQSNISYTVSSDAIITLKILKGTTTVIRTINIVGITPAGTYTISWDGKDNLGQVVADGTYTYQLEAVSPLVSTFKNTYKDTTVVDTAAPTITGLTVSQNPLKIGVAYQNFKFTLSKNASVTTKVVDSAGTPVKTVTNAEPRNGGSVTISWDGTNDAGSYVPEGTYTGVINAVDNYGKTSGDQIISFVAGYQPAVNSAAVAPNPYSPGKGNATISYNISNNALVTVKILSGTTSLVTLVNNQNLPAGDQSVTWDGKDGTGNVLGDGTYTLQVTAVSPTVSTFSSTLKPTFTIEGKPLEITGFSLSPDPFKITLNSLSIKYTLSENATVNIKVYQGSTTLRNIASGESRNAGANTNVWDGRDNAGNYVPEGTYTVSVSGSDASGNSTEVAGTIAAGYVPGISDVAHTPEPFNTTAGPAAVNFTLSNDAKVTLTILKGTAAVRTYPAVTLSSGANSVGWDGKDDAGKYVSDGPYTYQLDAVSPTVSAFKSTYKGTITVEAADPILSGLSVSPTTVKIGNPVTFKYTVSEPSTISGQVLKATDRSVVRDLPAEVKTTGGNGSLPWDTKDNSGSPITSGNYLLKLTAIDNFNKTSSAELAFLAGAIPVISNVYSEPATVDLTQGNQVTVYYDVNERSYVTVKIFDANNALVKTIYSYKEMPAGTGTAAWDCANGKGQTVTGTFTVQITASSVIGALRGIPVTGTLQVSGSTSGSTGTCADCHQSYPEVHPMANCDGCHKGDLPIRDCRVCHAGNHTYTVLISYKCTYCHNETYSYKIPGHGDIPTLHTAAIGADCQKCHNPSLSVEHPLHTDASGQPFNCNTCHQSTVTGVVYAITNGIKNCGACHIQASHEESHAPTGIAQNCTSCHIDSLTQEHLNNPTTQTGNAWTCDTCHGATVSQTVGNAVYNKDKSCTTCHTQANHDDLHATTALDDKCTTCHINNLTQEHLNNPKTQTDPVTNQPKPWNCNTCHASSNQTVAGAVYVGNMQCAACHRQAHNMTIVELVPSDIPLYPGFIWSVPQEASIWAGESWMPDEYLLGGRVVISNRRPATNGIVDSVYGPVYDYYLLNMAATGWTGISPAPTSPDYFNVSFIKGTHKATVWFYGGSNHNASPVLDAGYRIEVIYK
ncbi:MAG: FlgD immunoglobulin-like domain containing protein [Eubacteriales bacterium]